MDRVLWNTPTTLTHTFYVDGTATDPSDLTASIGVIGADGTEIVAPATGTIRTGTGVYTYVLEGRTQLDLLTVTWTATFSSYDVVEYDHLEIVGGHYCTISELQAVPGLSAMSDNDVVFARYEFEDLAESYTGQAWVPRFRREPFRGRGTGTALLDRFPVRRILAASATDTLGVSTAFTVTNWRVDSLGRLITDGDIFTASIYGERNVWVSYEHGADYPSPELKRACKVWVAYQLLKDRSQVGRDILSISDPAGYSTRYSVPDWDAGRPTGVSDVDSILNSLGRAACSVA